jgi:hypothetical protein
MRRRIERRIVRRIVTDALAAGYLISVHDGEEIALDRSTDARAIMASLFTTDEDTLLLARPGDPLGGWVRLIYGNDGWDVVNDYTTNLDDLMVGANKAADKLEELYS